MMTSKLPQSGFSDVDRDSDPRELSHLLDLRAEDSFHRAYKNRAIALLGLHDDDRVLDVGCGTGGDVAVLAQSVGPNGLAVGIDASSKFISEARMRHSKSNRSAKFVVADATRLPFADSSFVGCMAVRTFQHLADPRRALAEMVRVVRTGGTVVVVDPDHESAVIDIPEHALVRRFLNFRADTIRNGTIAHHMPVLFKELGLHDVTVMPITDIRTDYDKVEAASHYEGGIGVARDVGVLTAEEAERLLRAMREASAADRFLCAMTYWLTAGRTV